MSEIITRPIGTRFKCNGVELEVVENTRGIEGYCDGCFFDGGCWKDEIYIRGNCANFARVDGKDVYFKEVKS